MNDEAIPVGLGELKVSNRTGQILVCYGLGSCIGLALFDRVTKIGAMAHVVLPDSRLNRGNDRQPGKFADTAVAAALEEMAKLGAFTSRIHARVAGGAHMLSVAGIGSRLDIGARNIEAVRAALKKEGIPLTADDTGGNYGRTLQLFVDSGRLTVSTVGRGEREL